MLEKQTGPPSSPKFHIPDHNFGRSSALLETTPVLGTPGKPPPTHPLTLLRACPQLSSTEPSPFGSISQPKTSAEDPYSARGQAGT